MIAHHQEAVASVTGLITKVFLSGLRRYMKVTGLGLSVHYDRRAKATYILVPISVGEERYWVFELIGSDCAYPWSPKEVEERVLRVHYRRFRKWVVGELGAFAFNYIEGGTIVYVGAISRGCYRMGGVDVDENFKLYTRDIREVVRWIRSWNPKKIAQVFGDYQRALEEFAFRIANKLTRIFIALQKLFEKKVEGLEESCKDKGVKPYGRLAEKINRLRVLADIFDLMVAYSQGRIVF